MNPNLPCLAALLLASSAAAAPAPHFDAQTVAVPGELKKVVPADLDGDGKLDLLAVYSTGQAPHEVRFIGIFWNLGGHYSAQPDLTFSPPDDAAAFDVANVDGQPGSELILLGANRVDSISFRNRLASPPTTLVEQPTLFTRAERGSLPRFAAVQDLAGAGSADLLVPGPTTLSVYQHQGTTYVHKAELEEQIEADIGGLEKTSSQAERGRTISELSFTTHFPSVTIADANGDGRPDIFLARDDQLQVFTQGPGLEFPSKPSLKRHFAVRTPKELENGDVSVLVVVRDLDGDGKADVLVEKEVNEGISSTTTTFYLYLGRGDGFGTSPDQTLVTHGYNVSENQLLDVDGDGHPDLIVPSIKLGIMAIIRMLTTRSAKITFDLYPFEGRKFRAKSAADRTLTFKLDLEGHADQQAVDVGGDFDGDRRPDLLFANDDDELSFYTGGEAGKLFSDDPVSKVKVRALGRALPVDLDGSGRSDVILTYMNTSGHRGEIGVVHNLGLAN